MSSPHIFANGVASETYFWVRRMYAQNSTVEVLFPDNMDLTSKVEEDQMSEVWHLARVNGMIGTRSYRNDLGMVTIFNPIEPVDISIGEDGKNPRELLEIAGEYDQDLEHTPLDR